MLQEITPVLLTYNEAPNLARTLSMLGWAKDVVVVDSGSDDETLAIARRHPGTGLANASLVAVAGRVNTRRIATFDEQFRTLTTPDGEAFVVLPDDPR